jgi:hypothetical protein
MTNEILTAETIATVAAKLVGADLGLAGRFYRDIEKDFHTGSSNVVKVRVPASVAASKRSIHDTTTPIATSAIKEQFVSVTLEDHILSNVILSEGDLDLDLINYGQQVLFPQTQAVVKYIERAASAALTATPKTAAIGTAYSAANPAKSFTALRKALRDNGVTTDTPILAAVGSSVYADLLDGPLGTWDADGKVRGIEIMESTRLAPGDVVAFVKNAFALVVRAPQVPSGAPFGASIKDGDFAIRMIRSYDGNVAADRSLVGSFVAVQAMPLAVDNEDGTVTLKPNAGAVRIATGS